MDNTAKNARPSGSLGKNIRRLRLEKNMTQEELALRLNVTAQAVSKWENETGMPDISQIVPLASVFGTSTDVLFGLDGRTEDGEALQLIAEAYRGVRPGEVETCLAAYDKLLAGAEKYPGSMALLVNCMNLGLSLCLRDSRNPGSEWCFAGERADRIAEECERQALSILTCARNGEAGEDDAMRAREVLVYLYADRGDFARAEAAAWKFPIRSDFTSGSHLAYVNERRGAWDKVAENLCTDLTYGLQHIEDSAARLGRAYLARGMAEEAIAVYESIFGVIRAVYRDACPWPFHNFDSGDCHFLLAEAYLARGDRDRAVGCLEATVRYAEWADETAENTGSVGFDTPWLRESGLKNDVGRDAFRLSAARPRLLAKLNAPAMAPLRDDPRVIALIEKIDSWTDAVSCEANAKKD
ncbi:MAG: helix-turn-helix transcriptional regulator [Clostridia bacterium]|nr:helix-turn-helix transcriptional regulator [Clostridia bacterium]